MSTSVGGTVELRAPVTEDVSPVVMHTVKDIPIPADSTTQLIPNSYHLLITDAGPDARRQGHLPDAARSRTGSR